MDELEFKRIELSDRERAQELLAKSNFCGCEYTFGNNFVWRNVYNIEVCFAEGFYFCKQGSGKGTRFIFPAGNGDVKLAVELLREYADKRGFPLRITANKDIAQKVTEMYPDASAVLNRDISDYVYLAEDLENLAGKKYHGKRNHLNRFYENDWSFEPLTAENIAECKAMNERWRAENVDKCEMSEVAESKREELCIVECSFKHYGELGYTGGVLRVNGGVQAFTFGEKSSEDCFVVHVEKALREFQGAYTAINREFVKSLGGGYKYINREDDTGSEGLRKAKLSYHPVFLEEKFIITFGGNEQ
ncbi:MAG: phosphatidylglycerol lysyltransferase domain-containing protein [Lachnospiraceae bacterium]|nr:phosphatidylglycerol lysyltransferase domain-containing protein [Ruminococcus sp.]MCM1274012.1 phosphatidylglycerol lysyltransferase domain-containing protein [Lachnospiraceae bacterium]